LNSVDFINTIQRISTPTFAAAVFQTISLGDGVSPQLICAGLYILPASITKLMLKAAGADQRKF
jgi:hypothetical protein